MEELGYRDDLVSNILGSSSTLVLASSFGNKVTARNVSCIIINNKIFFQTDRTFLKYYQILNNPNVALCKDNIQIEGVAIIKGHPLNNENNEFIKLYQKYYSSSYNNYSHLENEVVIEVEVTYLTMWVYEDGKPVRHFFDLIGKRFYKEYYLNR